MNGAAPYSPWGEGAERPPTISAAQAQAHGGNSPVLVPSGTGEDQSQAKASEDNGSTAKGRDEASNAVPGDASRQSAGCGSGASLSRAVEASQANGVFLSPAAGGPVAAGEVVSVRLGPAVALTLAQVMAAKGISPDEAVARGIVCYAARLGCPVLARGGEGDLADLVDYPRAVVSRFKGGGQR